MERKVVPDAVPTQSCTLGCETQEEHDQRFAEAAQSGEGHEFVGSSPPEFPERCEYLGGEDVCGQPRSAQIHRPPESAASIECVNCGVGLYQRDGDATWYHKGSGQWRCQELFATPSTSPEVLTVESAREIEQALTELREMFPMQTRNITYHDRYDDDLGVKVTITIGGRQYGGFRNARTLDEAMAQVREYGKEKENV